MKQTEQRIMMGNEAIGRGLVENSCTLAASYPGTPASEVLSSVVGFVRETGVAMHVEWSVNEKIAFETALAHSYTGKRAAVAMKQVGLNVASDPFMRSAYIGVKGGFVLIVADDPGFHSSQTEQDSRFFARFAKIPVFDPSFPREAKEMTGRAFELSEKYELPVMLRPTTAVCHARQNVSCNPPQNLERNARFEKNPARWVATPQFLYDLHRNLNEKLKSIAQEEAFYPHHVEGNGSYERQCIIASGVAYANVHDILENMGLLQKIDLYKVDMPYPLNAKFAEDVQRLYTNIMVVEETYPVIETQLVTRTDYGRISGFIPGQGELTPDIIQEALDRFLQTGAASDLAAVKKSKGKRPTLCPGCSHRAAFYAIKDTFPQGIFPSDIGCYTLGLNLGAVDTCHCMGACISQGAGFYHAYHQDGKEVPPIVVTIGDSTFFHAGIPALINAVLQKSRIIVVILDNATTAMTGNQPPPHTGILADGSLGYAVKLPEIVRACGVRFLKECDPYDMELFSGYLKAADEFTRGRDGGVAVIIARHPCLVDKAARKAQQTYQVTITEDCLGCRVCVEDFECPALLFDEEKEIAVIDGNTCIGCGVCRYVCPVDAIECKQTGEAK